VLTALVDVLEPTGSDIYAHLTLERGNGSAPDGAAANAQPPAPAVQTAPPEAEAGDVNGAPVDVIARLGSSSALRERAEARLWLDTAHIHLFDVDTGERLPSEA